MLRLHVTVEHEYFACYGMNNSAMGIKVAPPETGVKRFATCIHERAQKKTATGAVFLGRLMDLFRLHEAKYGECKSKNVRSRHFYAKVHD